jgi:hypothetical protein
MFDARPEKDRPKFPSFNAEVADAVQRSIQERGYERPSYGVIDYKGKGPVGPNSQGGRISAQELDVIQVGTLGGDASHG